MPCSEYSKAPARYLIQVDLVALNFKVRPQAEVPGPVSGDRPDHLLETPSPQWLKTAQWPFLHCQVLQFGIRDSDSEVALNKLPVLCSRLKVLECYGRVRSGQVRSGQVRSGQVRPGRVCYSAKKPGTMRVTRH